ncbi:MBL fold metallo-hydrolase [Kaarinaea lacus]
MKITKSIIVAAVVASVSSAVYADRKNEKSTAFEKVSKTGLSVLVLGSGGPIATAEGRASAGYLIFTDGNPRILMDVGGGTYQRLAESGTNIKDLDIILLSHLHADHTGDLTPIIKTTYFHNLNAGTNRSNPIRIYGPAASTLSHDDSGKITYPNGEYVYPSTTDNVDGHYSVGKNGVERYLSAFVKGISGGASTFAYEGHDLLLKAEGTPAPIYTSVQTVLDEGPEGLAIRYIPVDHGPVPSVAFRIEYGGKSVVYSGDTGTKGIGGGVYDSDGNGSADTISYGFGAGNMAAIAQGADMLIYDTAVMECCAAPPNPLFHILHTQPSLIAGVAIYAEVDTLVLSHLTPITGPNVDVVKNIIVSNGYMNDIEIAEDLEVYNLGD